MPRPRPMPMHMRTSWPWRRMQRRMHHTHAHERTHASPLTLRELHRWHEQVHAHASVSASRDPARVIDASAAYLERRLSHVFAAATDACTRAIEAHAHARHAHAHAQGHACDVARLSATLPTLLTRWREYARAAPASSTTASSTAAALAASLAPSEDALRVVTHELRDALYAASDLSVSSSSSSSRTSMPSHVVMQRTTMQRAMQRAMHDTLVPLYAGMLELRTLVSHYTYGERVRELVRDRDRRRLHEQQSLDFARQLDDLRWSHALVTRCHVPSLALATADSARALCVEKYGDAPDVEVLVLADASSSASSSSSTSPLASFAIGPSERRATFVAPSQWPTTTDGFDALVVEAHVHFVLMEVLKNSMKAVIDRYGVLNVRDAPPIRCVISSGSSSPTNANANANANAPRTIGIRIDDTGAGFCSAASPFAARHAARHATTATHASPLAPAHMFDFFTSSSPPPVLESGYTYSRRFGASFTGLGVGLPMCRLHLRHLLGGDLAIVSVPQLTSTYLLIAQDGDAAVDGTTDSIVSP